MGLDQYGFARKAEQEDIEIMTWRKHANLEGWMAGLYEERGLGKRKDFNCAELILTEGNLNALERNVESLKKSEGFFWGVSAEGDTLDTKQFIEKAREYIKKGYEIIYTSWW
jgi:hypothetical protein